MSIDNYICNNVHVKSSDNQAPSTMMRLMITYALLHAAPIATQGSFTLITL